jgi:hypothetical protein
VLINRIHNQNWNINCLTNSTCPLLMWQNNLYVLSIPRLTRNGAASTTLLRKRQILVFVIWCFFPPKKRGFSWGNIENFRHNFEFVRQLIRGQVLGGWLMIRPYLTTMLPLQLVFIAGGAHARKSMWYLHPASWYLDLGCPNTIT